MSIELAETRKRQKNGGRKMDKDRLKEIHNEGLKMLPSNNCTPSTSSEIVDPEGSCNKANSKPVNKCSKCHRHSLMSFGIEKICFKCYKGLNLNIHIAASDLPIKRGWINHFQGWVLAPSYASWVNKLDEHKMPYMVDNGAWSDFLNGKKRTGVELRDRVLKLCDRVVKSGNLVKFLVLPDRVESWSETYDILKKLEPIDEYNVALPIQNGFDIEQVEELIKIHNPKLLFIGGSDFDFKINAVNKLKPIGLEFHIGKVHKLNDLIAFAKIKEVISIDTSTYSRPQSKQRIESLGIRLECFDSWLNGSQRRLF